MATDETLARLLAGIAADPDQRKLWAEAMPEEMRLLEAMLNRAPGQPVTDAEADEALDAALERLADAMHDVADALDVLEAADRPATTPQEAIGAKRRLASSPEGAPDAYGRRKSQPAVRQPGRGPSPRVGMRLAAAGRETTPQPARRTTDASLAARMSLPDGTEVEGRLVPKDDRVCLTREDGAPFEASILTVIFSDDMSFPAAHLSANEILVEGCEPLDLLDVPDIGDGTVRITLR
jgi:hypothetical protein